MTQIIAQRYHILEELGQGGMGTVYRGLDTQSQQTIAIKQLKPELTTPELVERFVREGTALRELNHPNIVKMLDSVKEDGNHYLIIEYLSGGDLSDLLKAGQLPIEKVLQLAIDICDALTRAHRLEIIHRDLKPANVLLAEDGTPRLTDFGIARFSKKERVTATDAIVGTVDYLAPEVLDGGDIDARADIWAFGVMLFEILASERPFKGVSVAQTLMAIVTQPVPDLQTLRPDAPVALIDLIYRMLEKSRDARIRSVRQVGLELEDILHGRTQQTPPKTRFASETPNFLLRPKHNLPAQTTPFVGREAELVELAKLLNDPKIRLITILASGGMGKTRLALAAAEQQITPPQLLLEASRRGFESGVYFVELAPLSDPANIVSAIAEATGYQFQSDGREPKQQILDFLGNKNILLVLDNFEHLLEGASLVTDILKAAPQVKILATSRQRLNQSGETLFNLEGMDFSAWESPQDALEYAAVKLFLQSAKRAKPDFEITADNMDTIARICKLVQGMPLGIILAAAWLSMLSPDEIAAEIVNGIDFLESELSDLPERHQSIRAVFDYSWDLLTKDEKQVFVKLSVFRGGFTREAAEAVAGANLRLLMSLMNKSLIRRDADSGRYDIHELLRQYSAEQLNASNMLANVRDSHANYYAQVMQHQWSLLTSHRQKVALDTIEADFDNIRIAWLHLCQSGKLEKLRVFASSLWLFGDLRLSFMQGYDLFTQARTLVEVLPKNEIQESTLGHLIARQAWFLNAIGQHEKGRETAQEALTVLLKYDCPEETIMAYECLAINNAFLGRIDEVHIAAELGLKVAKSNGYQWGIARHLYWLGMALMNNNDYENASRIGDECIEVLGQTGETWGLACVNAFFLSWLAEMRTDYAEAERLLKQGLNLFLAINELWGIASCFEKLGNFALVNQKYQEANQYYQKAVQYRLDQGITWHLLDTLRGWSNVLIELNGTPAAVTLLYTMLEHKEYKSGWQEKTNNRLAELRSLTDERTFTRAKERAKTLDLSTLVKQLLTEFGEDA